MLLALQVSKLLNFPCKQASSIVHPIETGLAFVLQFLSAEVGPVPVGKTEAEEDPGSQIFPSSPCFYPQRSEMFQWPWRCSTRLFFQLLDGFPHNQKSHLKQKHVAGCSSRTAQLPEAPAVLPRVSNAELQLGIQDLQ